MLLVRRSVVLCLLLASPCQAQRARASDGDVAVFDTFLRVVTTLGQSRATFVRTWPVETDPAEGMTTLRLTAADRLTVHFGADPDLRDTVVRVTGVRLWRDLPDTLGVRAMVAEAERLLSSKVGPPVVCSDPLGPPSHLFAPQHVYRYWPRGLQQAETRLGWEVLATGDAQIELSVGRFLRAAELRIPCDATLP